MFNTHLVMFTSWEALASVEASSTRTNAGELFRSIIVKSVYGASGLSCSNRRILIFLMKSKVFDLAVSFNRAEYPLFRAAVKLPWTVSAYQKPADSLFGNFLE
jgi:hypothetical protein